MNISQYIKQNERLNKLDFITVYNVIVELIEDGKMEWMFDDLPRIQPQSDGA